MALFNSVAANGYRVWLMSVDLPDPDTPVTQVNSPQGIFRVTFFKLLPLAPERTRVLSCCKGVLFFGTAICFLPLRYCPVIGGLVLATYLKAP